jgi:hypothetical protein
VREDEVGRPELPGVDAQDAPTIEARALRWFAGDDTGASSMALACHMLGLPVSRWGRSYPLDAGDFGRCERLLQLVPEWRPRLPEMGGRNTAWIGLAAMWDAIVVSENKRALMQAAFHIGDGSEAVHEGKLRDDQ